ncbi:MAG: site-specific integrase [Actinobacteria bacterium]|nr:site-specific integrase [Actinomycetota bacterium]MBU4218964.1 site-specific integrase [Actinomycetota bacterium]MBU4358046.1 site-specific integrase [Actinomycetota bacterium]MBU4401462.1 site-specific integrase [Actinomycetota bacterium]MCG2819461.1 site-specific integrase [Actinomycetes bacterium]
MANVTYKTGAGGKKLWYARYRTPDGKDKWEAPKGRPTKKNAEELLTLRLREIEDGIYGKYLDVTLGVFIKRYKEDYLSLKRPSTQEDYEYVIKNHIIKFFGEEGPLKSIDAALCQEFVTWMRKPKKNKKGKQKTLSARTINKTITVLRGILKRAVLWHYLKDNPATYVDRPQEVKEEMIIPTPEELQCLLDAVDPRYRALYETAARTGMREGEIFALRWKDVDLSNGVIHVRRTWRETTGYGEPKTKRGRRDIDISQALVTILQRHKAESEYKGSDDLVFYTKNQTTKEQVPLRRQNLLRRVHYPAIERAGIPRVRFHDLRHFYGSHLLHQSQDAAYVARQIGHSQPSTTMNMYSHPVSQRCVVEKLDEVISAGKEEVGEPGIVVPLRKRNSRS